MAVVMGCLAESKWRKAVRNQDNIIAIIRKKKSKENLMKEKEKIEGMEGRNVVLLKKLRLFLFLNWTKPWCRKRKREGRCHGRKKREKKEKEKEKERKKLNENVESKMIFLWFLMNLLATSLKIPWPFCHVMIVFFLLYI